MGNLAVDAPPCSDGGPYPLLVFSHGYGGSGLGQVFLTEALAARGWIVAAPDHNDRHSAARIRTGQQQDCDRRALLQHALEISRSGPDGRDAYAYRLDEIRLVLDRLLDSGQFGKLIDHSKVAVGGHSFGGFTALGVCGTIPVRRDARVKAVLLFSTGAAGYLFRDDELGAVTLPSMYFLGEREKGDRRGSRTMAELAEKVYAHLPAPKYLLEVRQGTHFSFNNRLSDSAWTRRLSGTEEQFEVIRRYSLAFLETHVAGRPGAGRVLEQNDPLLTRHVQEPSLEAMAGSATQAVAGSGSAATDRACACSLIHNGLTRTYQLYVPHARDRAKPVPLVLVLHGGFGDGRGMEKLSQGGFDRLADRDHFVVVYPDGVERHWNDGRTGVSYRAHKEKIDDVGFVAALIDHLVRELNLDPTRVYAAGISNGALMSCRLAAELSDKIAAVALVTGSIPADMVARCLPPRPVPVLIVNGTKDPLLPWGGGEIRVGLFRTRRLGRVISTPDAVRHWVRHNGCADTPLITMEPDKDPSDGCRVRREVYPNGRDRSEVILYAIEGGGHTWPGGWQYAGEWLIGKTCRDLDANQVIWGFCQRHARK
jgi:polyhydroxybutyrate depolymerase